MGKPEFANLITKSMEEYGSRLDYASHEESRLGKSHDGLIDSSTKCGDVVIRPTEYINPEKYKDEMQKMKIYNKSEEWKHLSDDHSSQTYSS